MKHPEQNELHLWLARLDADLDLDQALALLTPDEVKRAERFKFPQHHRRFIRARAALRTILSLYLEERAPEIPLVATPNGKLYLEGSSLSFNLSHSEDLALYAFTEQIPVGVDLEKIGSTYNDKLAERYFSKEEYAVFSKLSAKNKVSDFYRIWTAKEAVIKALGEKISSSLSSFSIPEGRGELKVSLNHHPQGLLYLQNPNVYPGFHATFATSEPIVKLSLINYERERYSR